MSPSVENISGYAVGTQSVSACVADVVAWVQQSATRRALPLAGLPQSPFLRGGAG